MIFTATEFGAGAKLDVAALWQPRNLIETVFFLDEAIFTKACALQLNPPRHNERPIGDGYHSC